jgi:uroporphyrinogen decarboxylase
MLKNDRLIRALLRQPVDRTPVWVMRQAGRYLPEYRALREKAGDFLALCKTPELACEATLQPLRRFPLDAAILFSDILTIPDAMGLGLRIVENEGPRLERPVRTAAEIRALATPDPDEDLGYVLDAIRLVRGALDGATPLIGFAGSPWTLACYMVEGGGSRGFLRAKCLAYDEPQTLHALLEVLADAVARYLNAQIAAGADAVMIFDTWGGILTRAAYLEFSLAYARRVIAALRREPAGRRVPVILFSKGAGGWLADVADSGCDAVGLDWTCDLGEARRQIGDRVALQGNMDPAILYVSPQRIRAEVAHILAAYGHGSGHVFNLGHGIAPDVQPERLHVMIEAVHEFSPPYHA